MSDILKEEIKYLVAGLDKVILEQAGKKVFAHLDQIRRWSWRARNRGSERSRRNKHSLLDHLAVDEAYQIAHAFSLFFQLVNLCEERARERQTVSRQKTAWRDAKSGAHHPVTGREILGDMQRHESGAVPCRVSQEQLAEVRVAAEQKQVPALQRANGNTLRPRQGIVLPDDNALLLAE
jgi:hypothetical protein